MLFSFSVLSSREEIRCGFSNRRDGSMHRHLEKENREIYFKKIGIDPNRVVTPDLVHKTKVVVVTSEEAGQIISDTDGLITEEKNLFLTATAADCFIIYFYDPVRRVVGIAHAGWRGIMADISREMISKMSERFEVNPGDLLVGISPGIQKCHFGISAMDKEKYSIYPRFIFERNGKVFVDLTAILKDQLQSLGVAESQIEDSGICTYCEERDYFSYRRDKPKEVQPMVGYIGLV